MLTRYRWLLTVTSAVYLAGCAASTGYDPSKKFAAMAPAQPMIVTGSRLRQVVSPDDPNPPTVSPTSVITREAIVNSGHIDMKQLLIDYVPNMVLCQNYHGCQ